MSPASVTEQVARRVRQLRAGREWSAQQLADRCASAGFESPTRGTIAKIESGVRKSITVDELYALARAFDLSASELLDPASMEPRHRMSVPAQPDLYLTIKIEPDAIDPERCTVTHWRQDDPLSWPPSLTGVRETTFDELEYWVDEVVLESEEAWSDQGVGVALEFVLPRTLLRLPVRRWRKEHESGQPRLLRHDYQLTVRSLERVRARHWHRIWRVRFHSLLEDPSEDRLYYSGSAEGHPLDDVLGDGRWVGLVLSGPPSPHPEPGDELVTALRSGMPLIVWHPDAGPEELRELMNWMLGGDRGLLDLPARQRQAAVSAEVPFDASLVGDLVVMWDDPIRTVLPDAPPVAPR